VASQNRAGARYHGDQAAEFGTLGVAVDGHAAQPPSWLVEVLAEEVW
jgi:histidinol-phosphate aminotransferase